MKNVRIIAKIGRKTKADERINKMKPRRYFLYPYNMEATITKTIGKTRKINVTLFVIRSKNLTILIILKIIGNDSIDSEILRENALRNVIANPKKSSIIAAYASIIANRDKMYIIPMSEILSSCNFKRYNLNVGPVEITVRNSETMLAPDPKLIKKLA